MWNSFKFYLSILLMCIGCLIPAAIFHLPEEAISGPGALVVFFAGGGLVYALFSLYEESYQGDWNSSHEIIMPIISIVSAVISIVLQVVILNTYDSVSSFGIANILFNFSGEIKEFYLRLLTFIFSGLSLYPLFTIATGEIDTSEYVFIKTTYYNGQEIKSEYISKSCDESKVSFFFTTVLVASVGLMASSLPLIILVLGLNVGQLFNKKYKLIPLSIGIVVSLVTTILCVVNAYELGNANFGLTLNITLEILPLIFAVLTVLFFIAYFRIEWISNLFILIPASFCMIFISYLLSLVLSDPIIKLISLFN